MESYIAIAKHSGRASWHLARLLSVIALFLIPTHMLAEEPHHRIKNIIVVYQENWSFDSFFIRIVPGSERTVRSFEYFAHTARSSNWRSVQLTAESDVRLGFWFPLADNSTPAD